jgi:uncharacterized membrane protein
MGNLVKQLFTQDDLKAIANAIGVAEKNTIGEIRVSVRQKRKWTERKHSLEALAQKEFHHLGMAHTQQRTGILLFLLLSDRRFHIFADEGIHRKVETGTWETIAKDVSEHFSQKNFRQGVIHGVQEVGKVLSKHFPSTADDKNELSNEVHIS